MKSILIIIISIFFCNHITSYSQDSRCNIQGSSDLPQMKILDLTKENVGVFLNFDSLEDSKNTPNILLSIVDSSRNSSGYSNFLSVKRGKVVKFDTPRVPTSLLIFFEKDKQRGGLVIEDGSSIRLYNKVGYETYNRLTESGRLKILHFLNYFEGSAIELPSIKIDSKEFVNQDTIDKNFVIFLVSRDENKKIHHIFIIPKEPLNSDDYYYSTELLTKMLANYTRNKKYNIVSCLLVPGVLSSPDVNINKWIGNSYNKINYDKKNSIDLKYYFW
jgi:hypothetical protein